MYRIFVHTTSPLCQLCSSQWPWDALPTVAKSLKGM